MGKYVSRMDAEREHFKELLEAAEDELIDLLRTRQDLEQRIQKRQSDVIHLAALCGQPVHDPITQMGLTDAIRSFLAEASWTGLLIADVEARLAEAKYPVEYANVRANIYTILNRLIRSGEVHQPDGQGSAHKYVWKGGTPPPAPPPGWLKERIEKELRAKGISTAPPPIKTVL